MRAYVKFRVVAVEHYFNGVPTQPPNVYAIAKEHFEANYKAESLKSAWEQSFPGRTARLKPGIDMYFHITETDVVGLLESWVNCKGGTVFDSQWSWFWYADDTKPSPYNRDSPRQAWCNDIDSPEEED